MKQRSYTRRCRPHELPKEIAPEPPPAVPPSWHNKMYCKAPWVSISYMPGGKFAPCCQWNDTYFDSPQQVTEIVGGAFLTEQVPKGCQANCGVDIPIDTPGSHYRKTFGQYKTDFEFASIQYLDFRNNNLCNLKCRSCGPLFSTSWSAELGSHKHLYDPTKLDNMDLSQCQYIYFAGGEPLLNPQHYELLAHLINNNIDPRLQYSTNMTVLGTKDYSVKDFWPHFTDIRVNASIDAVGENISSVRSGAKWKVIEHNLNWMRKQKNVDLFVAPVISALSIWWIDKLFSYFDWLPVENFSPTLVYSDGPHQLGMIPELYRCALIDKLQSSKFCNNPIIKEAILDLQNIDRSQELWPKFVASQLLLDKRRNESWFDNLPIRDKLFQEIAYNNFNLP